MPIDRESIDNFQRGVFGDSFLGIVSVRDTAIHLTLAQRRDGRYIPHHRYSRIGGLIRQPLSIRHGYVDFARWSGAHLKQFRSGHYEADIVGFSLVKTGPATLNFGFVRHSPSPALVSNSSSRAPDVTFQNTWSFAEKQIHDRLLHELKSNLIHRV